MASMNNWLGFSLSPQEITSHEPHHQDHNSVDDGGFNSEELSGECFDLSTSHHDSSLIPSLNLPPPFSILEAFNRNNNQPSSQDWSMKDVNMNYKSSSEIYHSLDENQQPKLENFLGNSFTHQHHQGDNNYLYSNGGGCGGDVRNNTIGLSMIKNWLRNNPNQPENKTTEIDQAGTMIRTNNGQNLSLSMSTCSQSTTATAALPLLTTAAASSDGDGGESSTSETKRGDVETVQPRKASDTFGQRTSIYRGVTRHRWTGRYEAHLWDNSVRREGQTRKGRQVYLGGYDKEEKAARSYDLAALKYWGTTTTTNFPISNYEKEIEEMKHMTRQEYVASLRRKSTGFSRGASIYRGVTRHHQHGRWQARIGRVAGNKDLYLGTFSTQEEAAEAYDIAAIKFRGLNAVTNFEISRYDVKSILESSTLPIGGASKRLKDAENAAEMAALDAQRTANDRDQNVLTSHLTDGLTSFAAWPSLAYQQAQPLGIHYPNYNQQQQQRLWCKQEQDSENFQDFHHQMGSNTHNFLQPTSVLHNLMSLDSPSMEQNQAQFCYGTNAGGGGGGYVLPMGPSTVIADHHQEGTYNNQHQNMFVSSYPYNQARNLYYNSQQSLNGTVNWPNNVAVWNDT